MKLKGKKVLVVGLEKTGEALCDFLLKQGAVVKVSEKRNAQEMEQKILFWFQRGVKVEAGKHEQKSFLEADLIIPSPGVPLLPELKEARKQGIKIISEIELAHRFLKGTIVGITGSNGKSTTATLTHKILKDGGLDAYLAGNIKTPLISFVEDSRDDHIYVTELSSFQLRYIDRFRASVSVFLNITPDHLDWHKTFKDYYEAKKGLITSQKENDTAILNRDDPRVWALARKGKFFVFVFSRKMKISRGCYIRGDVIVMTDKEEENLMSVGEIPLLGIHNQENVMAAALVAHCFDIPTLQIKESVKTFKGLEHRLEKVATVKKIDFYNDSKATNVDAALKSILSFDRKIILILGGRDKGGDFEILIKPIEENVKKIILIGEAKEKIRKALRNAVPMETASALKEAVRLGFSAAEPREVVLLAPACTSFDMFKNFEERGKIFKQEVLRLKEELKKENA